MRSVGCIDGRDLVEGTAVKDINLAGKVTETCKEDKAALWVEGDEVVGGGTEVVDGANTLIKYHRLGGNVWGGNQDGDREERSSERTAICNPKFFRVRAPGEIVDRTFLVKSYPAVEVAGSTEKVQSGLPVITLVRGINFGLREHEDLCPERVPLDLSTIRLEEGLLASRCPSESKKVIDFDAGWLSLIQDLTKIVTTSNGQNTPFSPRQIRR